MTRPRAMTAAYCIRCRVVAVSPWEADEIAKHRMEHRRADRRRAQWREYKRKRRHPNQVGALHSLTCTRERCRCQPIPVFHTLESLSA